MRWGCPIFVVFVWSYLGGDETYMVTGETRLIGSARDVVAVAGDDVILPCQLDPVASAVVMTVEWTRPDLTPPYVHVMQDGREVFSQKYPGYKHRTALLAEELPHGNVSLRLSNVNRADRGSYRCFLPVMGCDLTVRLVVVSLSQPVISQQPNKEGKLVLQCESGTWYPEPEVVWLDSEDNVLPAGPEERHTNSDGLYTVRRNVTVNEAMQFTCRVQLPKLHLRREAKFPVADELLKAGRSENTARISTRIGIFIGILIGILLIVIVLLVFWTKRKTKKAPKASSATLGREEYPDNDETQLTVNINTNGRINNSITMDMVRDKAEIVFLAQKEEEGTNQLAGSAKPTDQSEKAPLMTPEGSITAAGEVEEAHALRVDLDPVEASTSSVTSTSDGYLMIPFKRSKSIDIEENRTAKSLDEWNATLSLNQKSEVPRRHTLTHWSGDSSIFCESATMTRRYRAPIRVSRKGGSLDIQVTLVENDPLTPDELKVFFPGLSQTNVPPANLED